MSTAQVPATNGRAVGVPSANGVAKSEKVGAILRDYTPTQITRYRATIAALSIAVVMLLGLLFKSMSTTASLHAAVFGHPAQKAPLSVKDMEPKRPTEEKEGEFTGAFSWKNNDPRFQK